MQINRLLAMHSQDDHETGLNRANCRITLVKQQKHTFLWGWGSMTNEFWVTYCSFKDNNIVYYM